MTERFGRPLECSSGGYQVNDRTVRSPFCECDEQLRRGKTAETGRKKMSGTHLAAATARQGRAKRRQIREGARAVFLAQGFDGASMGEIARQAGVSKGTLYVYFESKEELFAVIAREACKAQAETLLALDPDDHDVEAVLTRLGRGYVRFLSQPGLMSPIRTVIS